MSRRASVAFDTTRRVLYPQEGHGSQGNDSASEIVIHSRKREVIDEESPSPPRRRTTRDFRPPGPGYDRQRRRRDARSRLDASSRIVPRYSRRSSFSDTSRSNIDSGSEGSGNSGYLNNESRTPVRSRQVRQYGRSRRRPSRSFISRHERYRSSSDSDQSDTSDDAFNFIISRRSASVFSQDSTVISLESKHDAAVEEVTQITQSIIGDRSKGLNTSLSPEKGYNILHAEYDDSASGIAGHLVKLKVVEDFKKHQYSLYRWIHFRDKAMNFDRFRNALGALTGLTDNERAALVKLSSQIRVKFDRLSRTGKTNARRMLCGTLQQEIIPVNGTDRNQSDPRFATWVCLPYFSLDRYVDDFGAFEEGAHPKRTLNQTRFAFSAKQRDMQQAVCCLPDSEQDFCYHVSQIWHITIGGSMLITCSELSIDTLRDTHIPLSIVSSPDPYKDEQKKVLISWGSAVMWSFLLDECQTWFALTTKFAEFPLHFRFMYRSRLITPDLWPRIVHQAKYVPGNLNVTFDLRGGAKVQARGILRRRNDDSISGTQAVAEPESTEGDHSRPLTRKITDDNGTYPSVAGHKFSAFVWLRSKDRTNTTLLNNKTITSRLLEDMRAADNFLHDETGLDESLAYQGCKSSSHAQILTHLQEEAASLAMLVATQNTGSDAKRKQRHGYRVDLFNAVEFLFEFFVPISLKGPTIDQFWGGVHLLLGVPLDDGDKQDLKNAKPKFRRHRQDRFDDDERQDLLDDVEELMRVVQPLQDLLSQAAPEDQENVKIPDQFVKAWLHVVMLLVYASQESDLWREHCRKARRLLDRGTKSILQSLIKRSVIKNSVVMPAQIATILQLNLLRGISSAKLKREIAPVYTEYFDQLQTAVSARPLDRGHQDKLNWVEEEISVILDQLRAQRSLLILNDTPSNVRNRTYRGDEAYEETRHRSRAVGARERSGISKKVYVYDVDHYAPDRLHHGITTRIDELEDSTKLSPIDEKGFRGLFSQDCVEIIEANIREFEEMRYRAMDLKADNIRRIDTNKDRQDNAIYAFTVVTIVFLPLSTVAGILGMNTNDVRNMEVDQWVFWAVALPVLLLVLFLCLAWTGELHNFWQGFQNLFRRRQESRSRRRMHYSYD